MAINTVVVLTKDQEKFQKKLAALKLPDLEVITPENPGAAANEVKRATILLAQPLLACQYINDAENVAWLQSTFAGVDALMADGLRKDYALTNVRNLYGAVMNEYVFSYVLMFEKETLRYMSDQHEKIWRQQEASSLKGKVIAILGTGSIGTDIARTAKVFGMRTYGYRTKKVSQDYFDVVHGRDELRECLQEADYVVSVLPKTPETTHLFNTETFSWMKATATFMNIGRGNAVNETDLIGALKEGAIARAVLDVFEKEPLPTESELWSVENLYLTPHVSGYVVSDRIFEIFSENYGRFLKGKPLLYQVDFSKGY